MVNIPKNLVVADSWEWSAEYGDYPASSWTATAYFENAAGSFNVSSSANGSAHVFAETAANTASLNSGSYYVQVRVVSGSTVKTVEQGWCQVQPDPAGAGNTDHRSWARRTLEAIEAFLAGNATTAQQSVSIGGRTISRWSLPELMQWRDKLRAEVRADEQAESAGLGRNIKVRFGRA